MSAAQTQKALVLEEEKASFVVREIPKYIPALGEILIKVKAAALNPVDWKIQKYGSNGYLSGFPAVLGTDFAGDVESVGEGVSEFKIGDRVFGHGQFVNDKAGFQQFTTSLAATTARIPDGFTYDDVGSLPLGISTAYSGLYAQPPRGAGLDAPVSSTEQGKYSGTPAVILGGASSVGQFAIQFAKLSGFSPLITTASLKHTEFLKSLGADHVLDRSSDISTLTSAIHEITGGKQVEVVYDAISLESTQATALALVGQGGKLVTVLPSKLNKEEVAAKNVMIGETYAALRIQWNAELLETLYHDKISTWLTQGIIKPNRIEILPNGLEGIVDGLKKMETDQVSGVKLIAHPQETV